MVFFHIVPYFLIATQGNAQSLQSQIGGLEEELQITDDDSLKIQLYVQLADIYKDVDPQKMSVPIDSALILAQKLNWALAIGIVYNYKGIYHRKKGEYQQSLQYNLAALDIMEQLENNQGIADNVVNIGNLYSDLKNYERARDYMLKALTLKEATGTNEGLIAIHNNLGTISHSLKDFDNALEYYNKALELAKEANDQNSAITQFINIANTYLDLGTYDQSLEYLFLARDFCANTGNREALPYVLITLGQVYKLKKEYPKAIDYLEEGLQEADSMGARQLIQQAYLQLSDVYKQTGDSNKAYEAYEKYTLMGDSLQRNLMEMTDVQATYQLKKRDQVVKAKDRELIRTASQKKKILYTGIVVTLVLALSGGLIFRRKQKLVASKEQMELENVILGQSNIELRERLEKLSDEVEKGKNKKESHGDAQNKKYRTSALSKAEREKYMHHILGYMDSDRPYLDSELTLASLAEMLSMPPYHLSEVLNESLRKNFYDFINIYRVEVVKEKLTDSGASHLTLLGIAFDSGFNSKTAFNRAFKKVTGLSPSRYKQELNLTT